MVRPLLTTRTHQILSFLVALTNSTEAESASASLRSQCRSLLASQDGRVAIDIDEEWSDVVDARSAIRPMLTGDAATCADGVNAILASPRVRMRLMPSGEDVWCLQPEPVGADLGAWLLAATAGALTELVLQDGISRLGSCESPGCGRLRFDGSRNASKRYCSISCGNRIAVAAYRSRRNRHDSADSFEVGPNPEGASRR